MEFPINILPGIFTDNSDRASMNRWKNGNRVRFRKGIPQKLGGWTKQNGGVFTGIARGIADWKTLALQSIVGIGTHTKLWLLNGGTYYDTTPYRDSTAAFPPGASAALTNPFATTISDTVVTVTHAGHGTEVGATVYYANVTNPVGGITINGAYVVTEVPDGSTYKFDSGTAATSSVAAGGGTVDWAYEINPGKVDQIAGLGWGASTWGASTWGTARSSSNIALEPRTWSLDNWGEDLIANPRGGGIWLWDATDDLGARAELLTNAPAECDFVLVSPLDRYLIAFSCTPDGGGGKDPLLIRWTDQNANTVWTPTALNLAGEKRLNAGSEIRSAVRTSQEILIFTDNSLLGMFQVGPPNAFGFRDIADGCGIVSPLARVQYGNRVYWMTSTDFWFYEGGAAGILPCDVRNYVFDDINLSQKAKFHTGINQKFNEIWFFYVSSGSTEIDRYAAINTIEGSWHIGAMVRTSWLHEHEAFDHPSGTDVSGNLFLHEMGYLDDGADMGEHIETWDMGLPTSQGGPGEIYAKVRKYISDFETIEGTVDLTMKARKYPQGQQITKGPFPITSATEFVKPRIRGRQIAMRFDGGSGDNFWRMGVPFNIDAVPHGKR